MTCRRPAARVLGRGEVELSRPDRSAYHGIDHADCEAEVVDVVEVARAELVTLHALELTQRRVGQRPQVGLDGALKSISSNSLATASSVG